MEFYTIREAARRSGLSPKAWYEGAAGTASVPRIRFGRSIRLLRKDVENFINKRIAEAEPVLRSPGLGANYVPEGINEPK